jgi:putative membrane protein
MSQRKVSPLGWLGIALGVAIALMAIFGVLGVTANGGYYGMMGTGSWGWGIAMMAVPLAILMIVLMAALKGLADPSPLGLANHPSSAANPLEVLDRRYARGELSRDEYLTIRADLARRQ